MNMALTITWTLLLPDFGYWYVVIKVHNVA